jgi:hypothetical protein
MAIDYNGWVSKDGINFSKKACAICGEMVCEHLAVKKWKKDILDPLDSPSNYSDYYDDWDSGKGYGGYYGKGYNDDLYPVSTVQKAFDYELKKKAAEELQKKLAAEELQLKMEAARKVLREALLLLQCPMIVHGISMLGVGVENAATVVKDIEKKSYGLDFIGDSVVSKKRYVMADDGTVTEWNDMEHFLDWYVSPTSNRYIAKTIVGNIMISTVCTGFEGDKDESAPICGGVGSINQHLPLVFQTMTFIRDGNGGWKDPNVESLLSSGIWANRYDDAMANHNYTVACVTNCGVAISMGIQMKRSIVEEDINQSLVYSGQVKYAESLRKISFEFPIPCANGYDEPNASNTPDKSKWKMVIYFQPFDSGVTPYLSPMKIDFTIWKELNNEQVLHAICSDVEYTVSYLLKINPEIQYRSILSAIMKNFLAMFQRYRHDGRLVGQFYIFDCWGNWLQHVMKYAHQTNDSALLDEVAFSVNFVVRHDLVSEGFIRSIL